MKRLVCMAVVGLAVVGLAVVAQGGRERICLDAGWRFALGEQPLAQAVEYDAAAWRAVDLPHDWSIEQPAGKEYTGSNAWLPGGIGWYRKSFDIPSSDAGRHFELQFDGVYRHAQVWVNGSLVGGQSDGYTSFCFDITPHVRAGARNIVAVRVDNSTMPNCRWYSGSGIYRHVWLTKADPLHVKNWGTFITTPTVAPSEAEIRVVTEIENRREKGTTFVLQTELLDPAGACVARAETERWLPVGGELEVEQRMGLFSPVLWSVEEPRCYTAVSRIAIGGDVVDEYRSPFGVRDTRFDPEKGFFLNGAPMKLKGVCLHHDAGTLGAAVPERVWERRLENLKAIGCNAIRTSHNPPAPEFLDLCDRLGFLVMDEFVDKWDDKVFGDPGFPSEWKKNFRETIRRDRNHPSVVIWSVGNENHPPGSDRQTEGLERYCGFVRALDPTRPVVSGMERGLDKDPDEKVDDILRSCAQMDLVALNYGEQWCRRIAHRNPGRPYVSTESYTYFNSTEEVRFASIERSPWIDVLENDCNMGLFLWVGINYLGEAKKWPGNGASSGLFDHAGFRTVRSYLYESFWSDRPMVHLAVYQGNPDDFSTSGRWGWPPMDGSWNRTEGSTVDLACYSNCEFVELRLNGRKLGTLKRSDFPNGILKWRRVPYERGTVRAVGFVGGKEACAFDLRTAGEPVRIALSTDAGPVGPGGILHVEAELEDAQGNKVLHADRLLGFQVEGGTILGLDNGGLDAVDDLRETSERKTRQGRCLAIIRRGNASDPLRLVVGGGGLEQAVVEIR